MSVVYVNGLFSNQENTAKRPDDFEFDGIAKANRDLILCRDLDGNPTAIYGDDCWDFNPYRLSASRVPKIDFTSGVDDSDLEDYKELAIEIRHLLFCLIYFGSNGPKGRLTPATLYSYFTQLRLAARFCLEMKKRPLVGSMSLRDLLSNSTYLKTFCNSHSSSVTFNKRMPAILKHLSFIGESITGISTVSASKIGFSNKESKQYPVIPARIYLRLMESLEENIHRFYEKTEELGAFLRCFERPMYGVSHASQKSFGVGGAQNHLPDMQEAISQHNLESLFTGRFAISSRRSLVRVIRRVLFIVKNIIHLYTGMRHEEVMRMPYDCLNSKNVTEAVNDNKGFVADEARIVSLISSTTKFTGYRKVTSWLAPDNVIKAIEVAQSISAAVNDIWQCDLSKRMLFVSPSKLTHKTKEVAVANFSKERASDSFEISIIEKGDFDELLASDPRRNFQEEPLFQIGQPWPLTSHQFRRSLAFYGSNSGFLSLPTIKRQFKHLSLYMSRYYSNNFENLKTIFGFYDDEKQDYVLPDGHMAFEFQLGMPINKADQIIADVLGDESQLFGKAGSYIERQKKKLDEGTISIYEIRTDTEKRIAKGELSYRKTLLGGCTKVGACDTAMLGEFTECLTCEGSIIKTDLVEKQIKATEAELAMYEEGSCEFEIVCQDLEKLKQYQAKVISREALE